MRVSLDRPPGSTGFINLTKPIQPKLLTETLNKWTAAAASKSEIA